MEKYAIYCTPEQTKRAIELGAPVEQEYDELICKSFLVYPTTEEMIGWLEDQKEISDLHIFKLMARWSFDFFASNGDGKYDRPLFTSRKEATLAAIDTALKYLKEQRNSKIKIVQPLEMSEEVKNDVAQWMAEYINKRILEHVMEGVKRGSNHTSKKKKRK